VGVGAKVKAKLNHAGGHLGASLHVEASDYLLGTNRSSAPERAAPPPLTIKAEVDAGLTIPGTHIEGGGEAGLKETPLEADKGIHGYATPEAKLGSAGTDGEKYSIGGSAYNPEADGLGGGVEVSAPKSAVNAVVNDAIDTAKQIGTVIQNAINQ